MLLLKNNYSLTSNITLDFFLLFQYTLQLPWYLFFIKLKCSFKEECVLGLQNKEELTRDFQGRTSSNFKFNCQVG